MLIDGSFFFFFFVVMKSGLVINASGSAFFESGAIQLQCTVHGPRPIRGSFIDKASFNVEVKIAPFNVDPTNPDVAQLGASAAEGGGQAATVGRPNGTSVLETGMASFIQTSLAPAIRLESYPKSAIDVFVTVINRGASAKAVYAAGVNAASVALTNADIAMRDIVTCGSVVIPACTTTTTSTTTKGCGQVFVDPEFRPFQGDISVVVSYMTARNEEIVGMIVDGGVISEEALSLCLSSTLSVAKSVRALVNRQLITEFRAKEQALLAAVKPEDTMEVDN